LISLQFEDSTVLEEFLNNYAEYGDNLIYIDVSQIILA